jgi:cell division protein FtsQ
MTPPAGRRIVWRCLIALLAVAAGLATWLSGAPVLGALREHPYFEIDSLRVEGCGPRLDESAVRAWLGFGERASVWDADPAWVLARLRAHPYVASASVRREFPDTFEIRLREREPVAVAVLDDLYYVDRTGAVFGPLDEDDAHDFPVITGISAESSPGQRRWALRRALRLLRVAERAGGFAAAVSEVHVDPVLGAILYPAEPRVPVVLGWGSLGEKLARAARVLREWEGATDRLAKVDTRFRNQVVVKVRPEDPPKRAAKRGRRG